MLRCAFLALSLLWWSGAALAAAVVDATGRGVEVPEHIARVLPAGPPAAVLLAALAPDLMLGWTSPVSDDARALLAPEAARLPQVPRLTGRDDVADKIVALKPDLILDYGTVAPRYADLAQGDTTAHRRSHRAAGRGAGGDSAYIPAARRHSASAKSGRRRWPGSPRHCWPCRRSSCASARALRARCRWPDRRRTGNRSRRDLHPSRLAGCRAGRVRDRRARPVWTTFARSIPTCWSSPIPRCARRSPNRTHGGRCARCARDMRSSHPACRSAGWTNRRRSIGCSVLPGSAAAIRGRSRPCSTPWSTAAR